MMDPFAVGIVGVFIAIVLLAIGVHIALALGAVGLFGMMFIIGFDQASWQATALIYNSVAAQSFIVIPLFVFMGLLAGVGGLSQKIYEVLRMWMGGLRGGLGIATVFSCTAFGVCTGSSLVTAAVFSKVSAPEMRRHGYDKKIAYGICAAGGSIGMLIPPSILLVIYGIISQESVGRLLIAGIAPGVILALAFSLGILVIGMIKPVWFGTEVHQRVGWVEKIVGLTSIWPIIFVGVLVIGGIFGGFFSPTEAAAFGAAALLILTMIFTKPGKRWQLLKGCIYESIVINAMVFFILFGAGIFARFLMFAGITPNVLSIVTSADFSNYTFVIVMAAIYLVMGCFIDSISMLSITLPILTPVIHKMGINPIWFAMVTVTAIECGLVTPPVGLNVYATHGAAEKDVSLEDVFRGSAPFFFMMLAALAVIIAFPWLSTILPNLMIGK
jgi:tripartite ATP-independent transporter DctM subunit